MPTLQWIAFASDLVAFAGRCIPVATREFDIYSLWFFGLDIIQVHTLMINNGINDGINGCDRIQGG